VQGKLSQIVAIQGKDTEDALVRSFASRGKCCFSSQICFAGDLVLHELAPGFENIHVSDDGLGGMSNSLRNIAGI
jgi:hypothetical protein